MKKLSEKNKLTLVDASNLIQRIDANFVDSAHLTPNGMRLLAECLAEKIEL